MAWYDADPARQAVESSGSRHADGRAGRKVGVTWHRRHAPTSCPSSSSSVRTGGAERPASPSTGPWFPTVRPHGERRIMRRVLHRRYGEIGLGEGDPQPRPVVGSLHVAGGFVITALIGSEFRFAPADAPQPFPMHLTPAQIEQFEKPDFMAIWPMPELIPSWGRAGSRSRVAWWVT